MKHQMRKSNDREIPIYGLIKSYRHIKQPLKEQKLMLIHNHDCKDAKRNICGEFKENFKRYQCICG